MKKNTYLKILLILFAIVLIFSCTKEIINMPKDALFIEKAKIWYEKQQTEPVNMLKSTKSGKKTDCTPDWGKAVVSNNDDYEVVEVPLTSLANFGFSTQESMELSKKNNDPGLLNSISCFIVQKNKKTGLLEGYIMTIIGDAVYLKTGKNQLSSNTYLKKDKDFSGYILFHDTDGAFVNGWEYKKGKVSGKMKLTSPNQSLLRLKSVAEQETQCYNITIFYYYIDNPGIIEIIDEYIVCSGGGDGYAGSNGGSGGSPSQDPVQPPTIYPYFEQFPCTKKNIRFINDSNHIVLGYIKLFGFKTSYFKLVYWSTERSRWNNPSKQAYA